MRCVLTWGSSVYIHKRICNVHGYLMSNPFRRSSLAQGAGGSNSSNTSPGPRGTEPLVIDTKGRPHASFTLESRTPLTVCLYSSYHGSETCELCLSSFDNLSRLVCLLARIDSTGVPINFPQFTPSCPYRLPPCICHRSICGTGRRWG